MIPLTLAYSPCPNDTFIFYHLVKESTSSKIKVIEELHDVELLNYYSTQSKFDITKLSFFAYFKVANKYKLLNSGAALGRGCGPLLIKKKGKVAPPIQSSKIVVPGFNTTANLLFQLYTKDDLKILSSLNIAAKRYDEIMPSLISEEFDYGLIIHEERFTYLERGLEKVVDLGEWWESYTGKPIPLGAISVKRNLNLELQKEVDTSIKKSLELAFLNPQKTKAYIKEHSQSLEDSVIEQHIQLYVNDFSLDLKEEGKQAIYTLYETALSHGLIQSPKEDIF